MGRIVKTLSFQRGSHDFEPPDQPPHLISAVMRGRHGGVVGELQVARPIAERWLKQLQDLLGER